LIILTVKIEKENLFFDPYIMMKINSQYCLKWFPRGQGDSSLEYVYF
jgi:hypothetical protein